MKNNRGKFKQIISVSLAVSMILTSINIIPAKATENEQNALLTQADEDVVNMTNQLGDNFDYDEGTENKDESELGLQGLNDTDAQKDTDGDGLTDELEIIFGSDPEKADTDEDGLNDYFEIILGLDPLSKDSDNDGIEDLLEDADEDGLNNLKEIELGTDCAKKDTDGDGLTDGEEVYTTNTSPLLEDTDGDNLSDEDEIKLGLNPNNAYSDGITTDSERKIDQVLDNSRIESSLLEDTNLFIPSLSGSAEGVMDKKISINSYDMSTLKGSKGIRGKAIEIESSYEDGFELCLSYDYTNFIKECNGSELEQLVICQYIDNQFIPIDTIKDDSSKCLYAEITEAGIYFVLDLEEFLGDLDLLPSNMDVYSVPASLSKDDQETEEEASDEGNWVLLSDYKYVKLDAPVSETNMVDTDGDGISDYEELGEKEVRNLSDFKELLIEKKGMDSDSNIQSYLSDNDTIEVYNYVSDPTVADSDFDGIDDANDPDPKNNNFSGTLTTENSKSDVSYTMDYRDFFKGNTEYNSDISTISSLYSTVIYSKNTYNGLSIRKFMEQHGLKDIKSYNLKDTYSDSDLTEAYIGHRKVTYNGETKEVIAIVVRGTSSMQEWESNFDIGSTVLKSKFSDWKITSNHKGFDVASTRLLRCLDEYENRGYIDISVPKAYWITGHSRGAGIANIMGARLIDSSKEVYAYTFAAPSTTTSKNAEKYTGIYNIINKDDFVPYLPMSDWGFKHYGKSYNVSVADNYKKEWEKLTSIKKYKCDKIGINNTIDEFRKVISNRNDAYVLSCKCHGDGSSDNITIRNYGTSKSSREKAIAKIPSNALPYCVIKRYDGGFISGWDFTVCQEPEYFMQVLAAFMGNKINAYRFAVELNIADRYENAKLSIIRAGIGGIAHPHYPESYYLLSKHIS